MFMPASHVCLLTLIQDHDFPGAQAMLYAAGVPTADAMKHAPQVGISSVWWEGNPCNTHLYNLGRLVKDACEKQGVRSLFLLCTL